MNRIIHMFAVVVFTLGMSSSFEIFAVLSGSFSLKDYKSEVVTMMDYIERWEIELYGDQGVLFKVIAWMKNRVRHQDIPAILVMEIAKVLSDFQKSDSAKIQSMFDIIKKNKEARQK